MSDERRFSEDEVKAIMSRAIEMQQRELSPAADGAVPRQDLEAMARELGVSTEHVHRAIRELETGEPARRNSRLLGEAVVERTTQSVGVKVTKEQLEKLAAALPSMLGQSGQASVLGNTLSYSTNEIEAMRTGSKSRITIDAGERSTHVTLTHDMRVVAGGVFGGIVGGAGGGVGFGVGFGVGLGALGSPLFAALFPVGAFALAFFGARALYGAIARSQRRSDQERVGRIVRYIAENGFSPTDDEDTSPAQ